jgi:hypothetical protein
MFEVVYTVRAAITAENAQQAAKVAFEEFNTIVSDQRFEIMHVDMLDVKKWDGDYVPYGDNPKGLTIGQIEAKYKLGWES